MKIELVGSTKPLMRKLRFSDFFQEKSFLRNMAEKIDSLVYPLRRKHLLEIDFRKIDNILGNSTSREKTLTTDALKRFTQNFARVCYSQYDWNELLKEEFNQGLIDGRVLPSKHHSVFEHISLNFYLEGIPKIGAMILNNEKQYVTSEKSARYTQMKELEPRQKELYDKWMNILIPEIDKVYPKLKDADARNGAIKKLAQENARYMTSVFTPTKMAYTINLRQLNFLINEFEKGQVPYSGDLEKKLIPVLQDFASQTDALKIQGLEHKLDKKLSLFSNRQVEEHFGDTYSTSYSMSFASLAQAHRHRTINYHISDGTQLGAQKGFFVPGLIQESSLQEEWLQDLESVAQNDFPQAQLLEVNERGILEDFRLKVTERICGHAQYETMKNTLNTANKYAQYKEEFGDFYNKPKCAESSDSCNGTCVWGKRYATTRKI